MEIAFSSFKDTLDIAENYINNTTDEVVKFLIDDGHFLMDKDAFFTMLGHCYPYEKGMAFSYRDNERKLNSNEVNAYLLYSASGELLEKIKVCEQLIKNIDFYVSYISFNETNASNNSIHLSFLAPYMKNITFEEYDSNHKTVRDITIGYAKITDNKNQYDNLKKFELDGMIYWVSKKKYEALESIIEKNIKQDPIHLFDNNGNALEKYKGRSLENYNLTSIDFVDKNISGLDLSHNIGQLHINFDKLVHTLKDTNISGYNLNKFKFQSWNLENADLRDTRASIDILSCMINQPSKMNQGTMFDENNTFYMGKKKLSLKEVENAGIKIYKKHD